MGVWTVLVGAGAGSRFGGAKQFEMLGSTRVIDRALAAAAAVSEGVGVVLPPAEGAERRSVVVVMEAIRVASQRSDVRFRRYPQRWSDEVRARLDRVVLSARLALACKVSRSVVVRVAIAVWLDDARASPAAVMEAIRAELVPRGRKAKR